MEELARFGYKHSYTMLWRFNPEWYRLIGSKCKKCGTVHYPRKAVCVYPCDGHDLEDIALPQTGTIEYCGLSPRAAGTMGYTDIQPQFFATIKLDNDGPHVDGELINVPLDFVKKVIMNGGERLKLYNKKVRMQVRRFRKHDNGYRKGLANGTCR